MMFGRFQGHTNRELMLHLKRTNVIKSQRVFETMCAVDRAKYTVSRDAYLDAPMGLGYNATISAPHMHGYALDLLDEKLVSGGRALDVGSGSGYLTTCMALMLGPDGIAVGIEHIPELQEKARKNIENDHPELLKSGRIELVVGDGRKGYPKKAPYNAIHVGAAAKGTPDELLQQLAPEGRLIIPLEDSGGDQYLVQFDKAADGTITKQQLMGVVYVPLTNKDYQLHRS